MHRILHLVDPYAKTGAWQNKKLCCVCLFIAGVNATLWVGLKQTYVGLGIINIKTYNETPI